MASSLTHRSSLHATLASHVASTPRSPRTHRHPTVGVARICCRSPQFLPPASFYRRPRRSSQLAADITHISRRPTTCASARQRCRLRLPRRVTSDLPCLSAIRRRLAVCYHLSATSLAYSSAIGSRACSPVSSDGALINRGRRRDRGGGAGSAASDCTIARPSECTMPPPAPERTANEFWPAATI